MAGSKRYAVGTDGSSRTRRSEVVSLPIVPTITATTSLVSTEEASRILKNERGLELSRVMIQRRCASGRWQQGVHWVRAGKQYLINMEAVFQSIVEGTV